MFDDALRIAHVTKGSLFGIGTISVLPSATVLQDQVQQSDQNAVQSELS